MSQNYYIYYRVSAKNADEAEVLVRSMQSRLACRSGIGGKLLKKRDEPGLWMEVYEAITEPARFERLLEQAVDEFDLAMFLDGPRHAECFIGDDAPLAACGRDSAAKSPRKPA